MALTQEMKRICLEFLKAGLVRSKLPIWQGLAKDWGCFKEPEFQAFAQKHGILPETFISVRKLGPDSYSYAFERSGQ